MLRRRGIKARIARRGKDSSEELGQYRWVVERCSWSDVVSLRLCIPQDYKAIDITPREIELSHKRPSLLKNTLVGRQVRLARCFFRVRLIS